MSEVIIDFVAMYMADTQLTCDCEACSSADRCPEFLFSSVDDFASQLD